MDGTMLKKLGGMLGLGMGNNTAGAVDVNAQNAIDASNKEVPVDNTIDPYSEDTVKTQNELVGEGYDIGSTGVDGRMGPATIAAIAQRDKDAARKLLEQESLSNEQDLLSENKAGQAKTADGWNTPVYGNAFNNRFS